MPPHRHSYGLEDKPKDFKGTLKQVVGLLQPFRVGIAVIFLFTIASTVFSVLAPAILAEATTEVYEGVVRKINGSGGIDFEIVGRVALIVACLYGGCAICSFITSWIMANVSQKIGYNLRKALAEKIDRIPYGYFEKTVLGDTLSRITNDVDMLSQNLSSGLTQAFTAIVTLIGVIAIMVSINPIMALVVFLIGPVSGLAIALVVKFSQKRFFTQQRLLGEINGVTEETINGQHLIKAFNNQQKAIEKFEELNDEFFHASWMAQFISSFMKPAIDIVANSGYVVVAVVGTFFASQNIITVGQILAFIQYQKSFMTPVHQLSNVANILQQMVAAGERIFEFLRLPEENQVAEESIEAKDVESAGLSIDFDHVGFSYDGKTTVIKDFSAHVEAGQTVALVGPTGAGKTTIVKLLMRFYDVTQGTIWINGTDIRDMDRDHVRSLCGMVLQDTWLFEGSIRENLMYGNLDATEEEMRNAAKLGCSDHFISTLPDGFDFMLKENGDNVSQGERQLLTITRALIANRKLLILDEATSNVDTLTEARIQEAMDNLKQGRTSFVIAHRLSTIRNADLILVINQGDIVESGTHEELLALDGFYANLYNSQFDGMVQ